jgi:hypothetical protein
MSAESRVISSSDFAKAIEDLPVENLYTKAAEIANSVSHLERSNSQLQEYSDSIRNDSSLNASTREAGDKDCLEAIRENQVVIERQRSRIGLLKAEVERRGGRWHEGDFGSSTNGSSNQIATGGTLTDEELRRQMQDRLGDEDEDEDGGGDGMHL